MNDCERWIAISDAEALGERTAHEEREFLRLHAESCVECGRESAAWQDWKSPGLEAVPSLAEAEAVLRQIEPHLALQPQSAPPSRIWPKWSAFAGVLACAAAIALFVTSSRPPASEQGASAGSPLASALPAAAASAAAAPVPSPPPAAVPEPSDRCSEVAPGITLCVAAGAELAELDLSTPHRVVHLARGRAIASLDPQPEGTSFSIATKAATVTAVGTQFAVEVDEAGQTEARVEQGKVVVSPAQQRGERQLRAGEAWRIGPARTRALSARERKRDLALLRAPSALAPAPVHAANAEPDRKAAIPDGLARARELRLRGRFAEAAGVYREMYAKSPSSTSGRAALVSLGWLSLGSLNDASGALTAFDRYLALGGALSQEAEYGRVRALRALGRSAEEQAALNAFVRRYPNAPESQALLRRQGLEAKAP